MEALQDKLEEEGGMKEAQIALNKTREEELTRLRKEMSTQATESEKTIGDLKKKHTTIVKDCLLYTSPSPRDRQKSRMPSSA